MDLKEIQRLIDEKLFYHSTAWRRKRKQILKRDNFECQFCKAEGGYSKANTVHHIKHLTARPDLALVDSNLISCCHACHEKQHPERTENFKPFEQGEKAKRFPERW